LERTHGRYGLNDVDYWCSRVTTEEARGLTEILDGAGLEPFTEGSLILYESGRRHPAPDVMIAFNPVLPHGVPAG
jgi:hypothetical protein